MGIEGVHLAAVFQGEGGDEDIRERQGDARGPQGGREFPCTPPRAEARLQEPEARDLGKNRRGVLGSAATLEQLG